MMSSLPKISIIVCTLNDHTRLESTLLSITMQDYSNIELIVIDGGSDAKTLDVINKNEKFITTFLSEKDNGIYDAMNKGTQLAHGEWLLYLNCGDTLINKFTISNLIKELDNKFDFIAFNYFVKIDDKSYLILSQKNPKWGIKPSVHQAILFQKNKLPCPVYNLDYKICADYELIKRLKHFALSNHPICNFQIGFGFSKMYPYQSIYECYKINKNYYHNLVNKLYMFLTFFKIIISDILKQFNLYKYYFRIRQKIKANFTD